MENKMLIIKGALYQWDDTLLIPHYTGDFYIVDADRYLTKEEALERDYSHEFLKDTDTLELGGVTYYGCEYGVYNVNDNWELISDLSELRFDGELV